MGQDITAHTFSITEKHECVGVICHFRDVVPLPFPEIPGISPGSPKDGANYLEFLQAMCSVLSSSKTTSIATLASYWYLGSFPIVEMSKTLDYIVFMVYEVHIEWGYDNPNSQDGRHNGDSLRSFVNITETANTLSMIKKCGGGGEQQDHRRRNQRP